MRFAAFGSLVLISLLACADGGRPPAPYNLTAFSAGGGAELRWESDAADRFVVQRSEGSNYNFVDYGWTAGGRRFFNDYDVIPNEWYYYRVAAFYEEWEGEEDVFSSYSPEVGVQIR